MRKNAAVTLLTDVARNRTDAAARELGALATQGRAAEDKLETLVRYRDDYRARFRAAIRKGLARVEWENFQQFLDRLDAAIEQQRGSVVQSRGQVSAGQAKWREERRKLESFNALARRHAAADARVTSRREQREHDEQSAKAHRAKGAGGHHK